MTTRQLKQSAIMWTRIARRFRLSPTAPCPCPCPQSSPP